jgi:class 3 adenylate cyclase/tetratricopeptide (TPR) repeat protein
MECPKCQFVNPDDFKFCGKCGHRFGESAEIEPTVTEAEGERKHVTVLFSDLSGYTAMCERLDPEEVKEIMSRIFGDIAQVVSKYEGFVEKFIGDAVMALFGVPKAHEDDPVRAIRAAGEINDLVAALSPQLEEKIGKPLSMHSGINTGLVVTGEVDLEKGTHGVAGDTINLAARLCSLANPGEIVVGPDTCRQAEGHFTFTALDPTEVKGKVEPVQPYRVESLREEPRKIHRLQGLRADLIGRDVQMVELVEAVEKLRRGEGSVIAISGDAGTGKSRLIEEFKAALDLDEIQWREGHAYAYSQNIPYFPLIDLLNRAFNIEESDSPEELRQKVELGIEQLIGKETEIVPYIGSLYAFDYSDIEDVDPQLRKSKLRHAIQTVFSALVQRAPTVICLEDLHWADPSSLELLRFILLESSYPSLFLCLSRPPFKLLTSQEHTVLGESYQEMRLHDLSASEARKMIKSLLKTETIPVELQHYMEEKAEGNPFYLEEVINALIDLKKLIRDDGAWGFAEDFTEADVSPSIHGVIASRLDLLKKEEKRILQEASVIGRVFLYMILQRITELKDHIDRCLGGLEGLDLIRMKSLQPDPEYMFKHAMTQEAVYNGLLKRERQAIHEQIGLVMEQVFHDRLSEHSESLAFHFKRGQSAVKAVNYLIESGEKSINMYAVHESHEYFAEAYDLLLNTSDGSEQQKILLIDLLIKWASVFYYRGDVKGLTDLLNVHRELAESLDDKARLGMFYVWLGFALWLGGKPGECYHYLHRALKLGEGIGNEEVVGYACVWLSWACPELGLPDEGIIHGERAQEIAKRFPKDQFLYSKSLAGLSHSYYSKGEAKKVLEIGKIILDYGQSKSNPRSLVLGYWSMGFGHRLDGDIASAMDCFRNAVKVAEDPIFYYLPSLSLGVCYAYNVQLQEAEDVLNDVVLHSRQFGNELIGQLASTFLGVILFAKGHMAKGLKTIHQAQRSFIENKWKGGYALSENLLGKIYLQMVERSKPVPAAVLAKNIGFIIRTVPFASRKAEYHLNRAIKAAEEIGNKATLATACLDLCMLHKAKGRIKEARECVSNSIQIFEQTGAQTNLQQAKKALATLQ